MMKRIVTGHSSEGKSIFLHTGKPSHTMTTALGNQMSHIWKTNAPTSLPHSGEDAALSIPESFGDMIPKSGDTLFNLITIPGNTEGVMHATDTIDYVIVVAGEIWLELEDEAEVHLTAGDCVIQNGTMHAWHTRTSNSCTIAAILIGATLNT